MASEFKTSRSLKKYGLNSYKGRIVKVCPNSRAANEIENLWDKPYPGTSGDYAPMAYEVRTDENWREGLSRITAYYQTLRQPGKAKLRLDTTGELYDAQAALAAEFKDTEDSDGVEVFRWDFADETAKKGAWVLPRVKLVIETAVERDDFSFVRIVAALDHINKNKIRAPLGISPRKLWFKRLKSVLPLGAAAGMVYLDYYMVYNPAGWRKDIKCRKYSLIPQRVEVYDASTGKPFSPKRYTTANTHAVVKDEPARFFSRFREIDFSFLPGEMEW